MAESELEARLRKEDIKLQVQINKLASQLRIVHGKLTHPSMLARIKVDLDESIDTLEERFGEWTDYSGTSVIVGWSVFTTKELSYKRIDDLIVVAFKMEGTSDATGTTFTLPYVVDTNLTTWEAKCIHCKDDNLWRAVSGIVSLTGGSDVATFYLDGDYTTWLATGTKSIQGQFFYKAVL